MLETGRNAPDFTASTLQGEMVSLSSFRGIPVWLAFFRFASCPLCNYRVHEIVESWETFRVRDFQFLAVFQSPAERFDDFVARHAPPFPVIPDAELKLYRLYGLESSIMAGFSPQVSRVAWKAKGVGIPWIGPHEGPLMRVPGDYLIDRDGRIADVYRGKNIADHMPFEQALEFIDGQAQGTLRESWLANG